MSVSCYNQFTMSKTAHSASLSGEKELADSLPQYSESSEYAPPTPLRALKTRSSSGLLDFTHFATLTPDQLLAFDKELVALARTCMMPRDQIRGYYPMVTFREWLRGYGFFVSWDPKKYIKRGQEEGRTLRDRALDFLAASSIDIGPAAECTSKYSLFWSTLLDLLEFRGLSDVV